ncbi:MAG: hypothetical protein M0Q51_11135 [Bacteroidales bacterium]|nr:hypothetical protein [Bacteroidales bacterium]
MNEIIDSTKNSFFDYKKVIINFIYSFSWDITKCSFEDILKSIKANDETEFKSFELFNRPVNWIENQNQLFYRPNIVSQNLLVIQRSGLIDDNAEIYIPSKKEKRKVTSEKIKAELNYDLRIYENGSGNCTFSFTLSKNITFQHIHYILHLASGIILGPENKDIGHLTFSYLPVSDSIYEKFNKLDNNNKKNIHLTELYDHFITNGLMPKIWNEKDLWYDKKVIQRNNRTFKNWQTPYILTIAEVDEKQYEEFENNPTREKIKEIGSIAVKLTLDNDRILSDYELLKREYIYNSLGCFICNGDGGHEYGIRLKNYSHHRNLFYTIGKRSALAITPNLNNDPSYYVIPTLLNLVEILRSRWHLGSIVNLKLDDTFGTVAHADNIEDVQDELFVCRVLYGLFLQDPSPYLFDGGAITEIAEIGEELFWLKKFSYEIDKKFNALDKLVQDIYLRKRFKNYFNESSK